MTEEGFRKGVAYFKQAARKAPNYAAAHAGMATCFCLLGGHGFELIDPNDGMPIAKNAVLKALSLDNTLAEPHAFLGVIRLKYEWDWPGAEEALKHSIQLNPSYAQARLFYSFFLEAMGRPDESIREAEKARSFDPLSLQANINLGWQYLRAGWPERARLVFESTAELDPDFWGVPLATRPLLSAKRRPWRGHRGVSKGDRFRRGLHVTVDRPWLYLRHCRSTCGGTKDTRPATRTRRKSLRFAVQHGDNPRRPRRNR